eukprot:Tamp_19009.p1 GENE.Tamp_19009~~Tamp_19009.p1  ORF type:complete len:263 (-),score=40.30 Tamp_19009:385-1173(-)
MSDFATYRHSRWGSPRKDREVTPKIGAGGGGGTARSPPIVAPHLRNSVDLFDSTQTYSTEESLLTTPRGGTRRPSPMRSVQQDPARPERKEPTFAVRGEGIPDLLADLKAVEDLIGSLQDSSLLEHLPFVLQYFPVSMRLGARAGEHGLHRKLEDSYREWASRRSLGDVCLSTPEAGSECGAFLRNIIASWVHEECRRDRADMEEAERIKRLADTEASRINYTTVKIRAHFSRLPRDLQADIRNGHVQAFADIYERIAAAGV